MSYPGACEKCGGDTGQDRIDMLVREIKGLEEKIEAAQQHCKGCIYWEVWRDGEGECRIDAKRNPGMFDLCEDYKLRYRPQEEMEE